MANKEITNHDITNIIISNLNKRDFNYSNLGLIQEEIMNNKKKIAETLDSLNNTNNE